VKKPTYVLYK